MDKRKKSVKTTRRKFVSGAGIIAAGLALRPLSLFAQDEVMALGLYSPENYLSEKLISKVAKGISQKINSEAYNLESSFDFNNGSHDIIIGRDSVIENLIDEEKLLELNLSLIHI